MLILVLIANVAVYAVMAISNERFAFSARRLLLWGGDLGLLSLHGQPWRLLTGTFLHASPMHIIGNMTLLAVTGPYVEQKLGAFPSLACYLVCGVLASLCSAYLHPEIVGVGASGAIAGLLGIMVVLYLKGRADEGGGEISGRWLVQTIGLNAAFSLAPSVDWAAHLGGLVCGLLLGGLIPLKPATASPPPS